MYNLGRSKISIEKLFLVVIVNGWLFLTAIFVIYGVMNSHVIIYLKLNDAYFLQGR